MASVEWVTRLFHSIDTNDTHTFASFLTHDALFKFANQEPVVGKEAARQTKEGAIACHGIVTYTRHDSSQLRVPFANVFRMQGSLIQKYLIYVDASPLYAQTRPRVLERR